MTKFKLKISGKNIKIFQDNEAIGEGDDYKEVLAYVATLIVKKDIEDYEVWLYEKGEQVKLDEKNFDPQTIVKHSKKIKIEDDNDDDDEDDDDNDKKSRISSRQQVRETKPRFEYIPKNTFNDYVAIGQKWKEIGMTKKEETPNDSQT